MILVRAVFWLTVVALLMPREPDLGLPAPAPAFEDLRTVALEGLARVKADLAARHQPAIHAPTGSI